jgi:hypothetical protein
MERVRLAETKTAISAHPVNLGRWGLFSADWPSRIMSRGGEEKEGGWETVCALIKTNKPLHSVTISLLISLSKNDPSLPVLSQNNGEKHAISRLKIRDCRGRMSGESWIPKWA